MAAVDAKGTAGGAQICDNKLHTIGHAAFCFGGSSSAICLLKHSSRVSVMLLTRPTSDYSDGTASHTSSKPLQPFAFLPSGPQELPVLKPTSSDDLGQRRKPGFSQKRRCDLGLVHKAPTWTSPLSSRTGSLSRVLRQPLLERLATSPHGLLPGKGAVPSLPYS